MPRFLNVGGNSKAIPVHPRFDGWEHVLLDIDPSVKPDICLDARGLKTLEPAQFDAVFCSHNLEHFAEHDVQAVLTGFRHVLKPTGFAEIRVPDILGLIKLVAEKGLDLDAPLYRSRSGDPIRPIDVIYGNAHQMERSGVDYFGHRTGFSPRLLARHLRKAGFAHPLRLATDRVLELCFLGFVEKQSQEALDRFFAPRETASAT